MVVRKDIDNTSAIVSVTITREEIKPKIDAELKRLRQKAPIKGFRPGQAPLEFVKKMYGGSVFGDTLNDLLTKELYEYLRQSGLNVLGQPMPSETQEKFSFNVNKPDPEYVVHYEIGFVPAFDIKGLDKDATFERLTITNYDELAEDDLNYARKRQGARTHPETDIQENDIVRIAAHEMESADGGVQEGGYETTITLHLNSLADEVLKTQLLFLKKGDTIRFNARSMEKQEKDSMYRKYILNLEDTDDRVVGDYFEGTIEDVERVGESDLDQEFFDGYFGTGVSTKEEAIERIKEGIREFYDVRANALLMRSFQERLMAENKIDLPDTFLKRWLLTTEENKLTAERIEVEYPAFADNLRWSLLRDRIKERFNLVVTDEDVREAYYQKVRNYFKVDLPDNLLESSVERLMQNKEDVETTTRDIETDKIFVAIRHEVTVTDRAVPSKEFHEILDATTKQAEAEQLEIAPELEA